MQERRCGLNLSTQAKLCGSDAKRREMISKLINAALATTLLATPALAAPKSKAAPRDLLLVILKQEVNARDGAHKLLVERDQCMKFLEGVRSRFNKGEPVTLTLVDPAATGNVVSASCVHPDGSYDSVELGEPKVEHGEAGK